MITNVQLDLNIYTRENKVNFICVLLNLLDHDGLFLKNEISYSNNIIFKIVFFSLYSFCLWALLIHKIIE